MISCKSLTKSYAGQIVVKKIEFELNDHEFISILGPSGCGKSTLLRLLAGLEHPDSGSIEIQGQEISGKGHFLPPEKRNFAMVFQDFTLFPHLSISANIAYGVQGDRADKKARVAEMLELVNLPQHADKMPHQISGGEQQRVAVARALASKPRLMLMDEPFSNLDTKLRIQLRRDIKEILKQEGVPTILVTHDQSEAITFSDRVLVMQNGQLIQTGTPAEIYQKPQTLWMSSFVGEANHLKLDPEMTQDSSPFVFPGSTSGVQKQAHTLMIRPEDFHLEMMESKPTHGIIEDIEYSGAFQNVGVRLYNGEKIQVNEPAMNPRNPGDAVSIRAHKFLYYDQKGNRMDA